VPVVFDRQALGIVTPRVALDPALTRSGVKLTLPASYLYPTGCNQPPWIAATVITTDTDLIKTVPEVPLWVLMLARTSYFESAVVDGHTKFGWTVALLSLNSELDPKPHPASKIAAVPAAAMHLILVRGAARAPSQSPQPSIR
jgi:hypothetical protein